jgi:hypothetical protein
VSCSEGKAVHNCLKIQKRGKTMSYQTLDEYSDARTFDNFHDAKVEAKKALQENDLYKAAVAIGNMEAIFDLLWQHKEILTRKLKPNPSS